MESMIKLSRQCLRKNDLELLNKVNTEMEQLCVDSEHSQAVMPDSLNSRSCFSASTFAHHKVSEPHTR